MTALLSTKLQSKQGKYQLQAPKICRQEPDASLPIGLRCSDERSQQGMRIFAQADTESYLMQDLSKRDASSCLKGYRDRDICWS
jgi:hypothetical protein